MSVLVLRTRGRQLAAGLVGLASVAVAGLISVTPDAQAFDCYGRDPRPTRCPFVKIERDGNDFRVSGELRSASGAVLRTWHESWPEYTLWHWRWYGADEVVSITVEPGVAGGFSPRAQTFEFPASESRCFTVNEAGVFQVKGCNDMEDPPK